MSRAQSSDLPAGVCVCGHEFDLATPLEHCGTAPTAKPTPGSLTLCIGCARLYRLDDELRHVPVTLEDLEDVPPEQQQAIRRAQWAIVEVRRVPS